MNLGRLVRNVVLPVAFLIGISGCGNYADKQYHFKGSIDGEEVIFYEKDDGASLKYKNYLKEKSLQILKEKSMFREGN